MVTAAFVLLVAYTPDLMKPWIAVLVIGREFLVNGLRVDRGERGLHDRGERHWQAEDCGADRQRRGGHPGAPLGPLGTSGGTRSPCT